MIDREEEFWRANQLYAALLRCLDLLWFIFVQIRPLVDTRERSKHLSIIKSITSNRECTVTATSTMIRKGSRLI
jgi:hypothetical protein